MSEIKTVAIVGCGIGKRHIVEGYAPYPDRFRVVALCDLNPDRLNGLADEFGVERRTASFDDLLAMDDVDVIDICTPPAVHYEQVMAALRAGKHVICEKPMVGTLRELDDIIAEEARSAGTLMPIFQYRNGTGIQQAKAIIDAGIAGKPYAGTVETFWSRGAEYYSVPWRGKWTTELGGVLMAHAIHLHDLFTYLMGPPKSLFGRVATRVNAIETEDCASVSLEMENGALASFTATLGSVEQVSRLRLAFEHVSFESDHAPYQPGTLPWKIVPANESVAAAIAEVTRGLKPVGPRFQAQMLNYHEALTGRAPMPVTTKDARLALEIVTAIYQSSRTRTEQTFPIGPDHPLYSALSPG